MYRLGLPVVTTEKHVAPFSFDASYSRADDSPIATLPRRVIAVKNIFF